MTQQHTLLLVEDDKQQRVLIQQILQSNGYKVFIAENVEEAILTLKANTVDAVFSDWKLGTLTGLDLLTWVRRNQSHLGFAIATAYGTIAHAVQAIDAGSDDYLAKPFQRQELLLCIEKIINAKKLRYDNKTLSQALSEQQQLVDLVGNAPCMQRVYQRIEKVSNTKATVLIQGESGTGKELAARALHQLSDRKDNPFIALNCGAIPASIAEAELFGAKKGAYTGADADKVGKLQAANQGTLFLDEIGELDLALQTQLLRFLQESTVSPLGSAEEISLDVRVVAATHRDLSLMVSKGEFREDLFYRLNIVPIQMPPLRERIEDIPKLIKFFSEKSAAQYQVECPTISKDILKQLLDYEWPGNVRELSNRIERFVLLGDEQELVPQGAGTINDKNPWAFSIPKNGLDWEEFEKHCLRQALTLCSGNRTQAAKLLNLSYKTFVYRLDKYKIGQC